MILAITLFIVGMLILRHSYLYTIDVGLLIGLILIVASILMAIFR